MTRYGIYLEFDAEDEDAAEAVAESVERILDARDGTYGELRQVVEEGTQQVVFVSVEDGLAHRLPTPEELTEDDRPYAEAPALCGQDGPWVSREEEADADPCEECAP